MHKILKLTIHEFIIQNKINNLSKFLFLFLLFCSLSLTLINNQEDIKKFGAIFTIIYLPLSLIGFSSFVFRQDLDDGSLEVLLTTFSSSEIIITKFLGLVASALIGTILNLPIIFLFFNLDRETIIAIPIILLILLPLTCSLLLLTGAVQSYFRSNTNFLSMLTMPMLIPNIIMSGISINEHGNLYLVPIMIGIDLIIIPCALVLSAYLIKNIYNI